VVTLALTGTRSDHHRASWPYALARTPAGKMGATVYAIPALTVVMSWAVLGEVPRWPTLAGGALCLVGVAIRRRRHDDRLPETSQNRGGGTPNRG
jgi:uncharacterized membrane protein